MTDVDLTGADLERDVREGLDGPEPLVDAGQGEHALPGRRLDGAHQEMPAASQSSA